LPVVNDYKPDSIVDYFQIELGGAGANINVDGSSTTQTYGRFALSSYDQYITSLVLTLEATASLFDSFMSLGALSNGMVFRMKTEDTVKNPYMTLQTTWQLFHIFTNPCDYFYLVKESATKHYLTAVHTFETPVIVKAVGTYAYDDYIVVDIQDNLSTLTKAKCFVRGYQKAV
jgi:hypothetical protein